MKKIQKNRNERLHRSRLGILDRLEADAFEDFLSNLIKDLTLGAFDFDHHQRDKDKDYYQCIKIQDTYLNDTYSYDLVIKNIFQQLRQENNQINVQIILLNPFSINSKSREEFLSKENSNKSKEFYRLNRGLAKILAGLKYANNTEDIAEDHRDIFSSLELTKILLTEIKKLFENEKMKFELRFADEVKYPMSIIGDYSISSQFYSTKTSAKNAWLVKIDDTSNDEDFYYEYRTDFENIWKKGSKEIDSIIDLIDKRIEKLNKKICISHGRLDDLHSSISKIISQQGFDPVDFETIANNKNSNSIKEILENLKKECSAAIVIMATELNVKDSDIKFLPRPNIIHELGIFQTIYRKNRVLILSEQKLSDFLTNESDTLSIKLTKADDGKIKFDESEVKNFLFSLKNDEP